MLLLGSLLFSLCFFSMWNFKFLLPHLNSPFTLLTRDSACRFPLLQGSECIMGFYFYHFARLFTHPFNMLHSKLGKIHETALNFVFFYLQFSIWAVKVCLWVMKSGINISYLFHWWQHFEDYGIKLLLISECSLLIHFLKTLFWELLYCIWIGIEKCFNLSLSFTQK